MTDRAPMTDPTDVTPEQIDRDAAIHYWAGWSSNVPEVDGQIHPLVYAFAAHRAAGRQQGYDAAVADVVAWLRKIDWCSESKGYAQAFAVAIEAGEQALFEAIDASNDTGFLTEDLVKIGKAHNGQWSDPVDADEMMRIVESWTK